MKGDTQAQSLNTSVPFSIRQRSSGTVKATSCCATQPTFCACIDADDMLP